FYTNLAAATPERLDRLTGFAKLAEIQISLYGADEAGFTAMTRRPAGQFQRLLANLDHLAARLPDWHDRPKLGLVLRVGDGFRLENWTGNLADRALHLRDRYGIDLSMDTEYDDWGGEIAAAEVADLGITLRPGRAIHHQGACIKALGQVLVKADGSVDACACRDSRNQLGLGQLGEQSLDQILSWANPRYRTLLEGMGRGNFPETCRKCSVYRSVHDPRWARGRDDVMALEQALALIGK
ncbi:MAG: SPASM domain-containing protein, partial [Magnetospirillum sp.]|nr:SPASM domain-containing protein [Magnetospirillum sp.]